MRRDNEVNDAKKTKGKEWYEQNQNIKIVGRTYFDRDSGRLTHEIFSKEAGQLGTLAEEVYHGVFKIIRKSAPGSFAEIQKWYATRSERTGQSIDEAFAKVVFD